MTIIKKIKVDKIIITKQIELSENYKKFMNEVAEENINVVFVKKGEKIQIEDDLYIDILWPENNNYVNINQLNNNSMVFRLCYRNFSMIFTGDIEEIAEKKIIQEYKQQLNSTILKVGHHGSKTSSSQEFINEISPQIALIGVGENNKFGHPNREVINRLEKMKIKIYRTDQNGEVSIIVDSKSRIKLKTAI